MNTNSVDEVEHLLAERPFSTEDIIWSVGISLVTIVCAPLVIFYILAVN